MTELPQLHSTVVGQGPARLVFLHGLFGQGKNFTQVAKAVGDLATSTLVDLPNHGRSEWSDSTDYRMMADAVIALLEQMDGPVGLIGHSMGGKVAMRVALQRPDLVQRLMVVDISPVKGLGSSFDTLIGSMQSLDLNAITSRSDADEKLAVGIPNPVVRGFLMQNLRHEPGPDGQRTWHWQMNLHALARDLRTHVADWPDTDDHTYPGPVLWVAGEHSDYIRPEAAPAMRALFPKVITVTIKGAGHWVHSEQPEAFVSTLRHFLTMGS